jgi:type II secretory pathway pseudopilin PulG
MRDIMSRIFFQRFKGNCTGFTIVELLVIVAILCVMATITVVNISKFANFGDLAVAQSEVHSVTSALGAYYNDNHALTALPTTEAFSEAVQPYLQSGPLKGTYICDDKGVVSGVFYESFNWSGGTWNK